MKREAILLLIIAALVIVGAFVGMRWYQQSNQTKQATQPSVNMEAMVRPDSPSMGPSDAKVTVVEFLDPECESCAAFAPEVKKILKEFEGQTRLVIRYMPFHKNARLAASYMEAAGEQGKYWEMQEKMFVNQSQWGEIHGAPAPVNRPDPEVLFKKWAGELGLNVEQLSASAAEKKHQDKIDRDFADGRSLGVRRTPTIFVNGKELFRLNPNDLRSMIAAELKK